MSNKLKILKYHNEFLLNILKTGLDSGIEIINPLPFDARIIRVFEDGIFNRLNFVISSESFPELKDEELIPEIGFPLFKKL